MKKEILKIQIIQTIFVAIIFIIALLEKARYLSNNLIAFYVITIFVFVLIMFIIALIYMFKNKLKEDKIFVYNMFFICIEAIILGVFCGMIDRNVDRVEFSKHCEKTEAYVYNIIDSISSSLSGRSSKYDKYKATIYYTYKIRYIVNDEVYENEFKEQETEYAKTKSEAVYKARENEPEYKVNDRLDIYYNIYNPDDWRKNLIYASDKTIYIIGSIVIGFQLLCLGKAIRDYKKSKEEKN